MVKVGIIGCSQSGDVCWELKDVAAVKQGEGVFKDLGPMELVGCITCNGCSGKRIVDGAKLLIKWGADIIAFSTGAGNIGANNNERLYYERILKELSKQLTSTIILDCRNGIGV